MSNLHGQPDTLAELESWSYDLLPACIVSSTWPVAPGSGLTIGAFSTQGYVRKGSLLYYVDQPARAITLPSADGTYYLALTTDTHSTVGSFTRVAGSHYAYLQSASAPTYPDGSTPIASAVVSGGNITTVDTTPALTPPLSRQTANAVAITDGRISLGGHAPTGVLDVQGSVVSEFANNYFAARLWPVAPSGAVGVNGLRIEALTGASAGSVHFRGISIQDQPITTGITASYESVMSAGANRYNIYVSGTAQNYFAGNVGIGNTAPSYPLDVLGNARLTGAVGIGTLPEASATVVIAYPKASVQGLIFRPTGSDAGGASALFFANVAGVNVGSVSTNATTTAYNTTSDQRLKRNIATLTNTLASLKAVRPVSFFWNADDSAAEGFLAHELMGPFPLAVTGVPDEVHPDGSIKPQQVDHSKLVPRMVAWMQEMLQRLEAIESAFGL